MEQSRLRIFDTVGPNRYAFHPGHAIIEKAIADVEARSRNFWMPYGWREIVAALHLDLVKLDPDYTIDQVKEKFGGLRFYANSDAEGFHERIEETEALSFHVCQDTGTEGELTKIRYWYCTLSPHIKKIMLGSSNEAV